jgi:hypothetical protein
MALSGAAELSLVALETWPADNEYEAQHAASLE